ncbi:acyltransferase [Fictibacillus sp. BK138]|uniref:acyltransferase n=1 Tax=Fictibacillus sp. BK138 TaxID=2512121 RepID=UPI00102A9D0C|nr:acyltransferase family protein [Fictibacillus sp. BK138]RZT21546.1 surface polysaccharide O-acyltransferase-like enzyme [Fictibacillus sp. BK138]
MIQYANALRALAIMAVVMIHVVGNLMIIDISKTWWLANIIDSSARWSVPVFVMVSGALLLGKNESLSTFFKKRASKIIIPFIFWTVFYELFKMRTQLDMFSVEAAIKNIYSGKAYYHLWFLYMIVGIYFVTPIFRPIAQNSRILVYFVVVWFLLTLENVIYYFTSIHIGFKMGMFWGFTGYFLLGYLLAKHELSKRVTALIYMGGIIGLLVTIYGTYHMTEAKGKLDIFWFDYLAPNTLLVSMAIFVLFKHMFKANIRFVNSFAAASFGIYLVHPFFLTLYKSGPFQELFGFALHAKTFHVLFGIPATFITVTLSSYVAVLILQKIPIVKKIVP